MRIESDYKTGLIFKNIKRHESMHLYLIHHYAVEK